MATFSLLDMLTFYTKRTICVFSAVVHWYRGGGQGDAFCFMFFLGGGGLWNGELGLVLGGIGKVSKVYRGRGGYQFLGFDFT